jgi:hypothetical protein
MTKVPADKPSYFSHWWGMDMTFPNPCIGTLYTGSSFIFASVSFAGGIAALFVPPVGIAFGFGASWLMVQSAWIRLADRGFGVRLRACWALPFLTVPSALPPPVVEVTTPMVDFYDGGGLVGRLLGNEGVVSYECGRLMILLMHPITLICVSSLVTAAIMKFILQ